MLRGIIVFLISFSLVGCSWFAPDEPPPTPVDLAIHGGVIHGLGAGDASAVVIHRGEIVYVGAEQGLKDYAPARVIDLQNKHVLPGFSDGHGDLFALVESLQSHSLVGLGSVESVVSALVAASSAPEGVDTWVLGVGWDDRLWTADSPVHHGPLSEAFPYRPVALTHVDGKTLLVNQRAMELAGLFGGTDSSVEGVERSANGDPTGVLRATAADKVLGVIPETTLSMREDLTQATLDYLAGLGLTSVHAMGLTQEDVALLEKLEEAGRLPLRV